MKPTLPHFLFLLSILSIFSLLSAENTESVEQERLIILTDIEADPDDTQSLVRLLLYSNCIDIKGIVATTSCWRKTNIQPESIRRVIRAYAEVQPNLTQHEPGFPSAKDLLSLVINGQPTYGMDSVGDGKDTAGSNLIIQELEKEDPRPLWISVWGGVNTLAQALHQIEATRTNDEAEALYQKIRVYTISDQDDSGVWIRKNFPSVQYIVSPGDHYGSATWTGINSVIEGWNNETISNAWFAENIQQNHGPLGAVYPDVSWGVEGDTPAFLGIIPNGLNAPEHPEWGGWGGRYEMKVPEFTGKKGHSGVPCIPETRAIWTDTSDTFTPFVPKTYGRNVKPHATTFEGNKVTLWRWRDDFQNDFAARMDWCLASYEDVNHSPVPTLSHPTEITLKSGQGFELDASPSSDPDGDNLSFLWFVYPEAGTYEGDFKMGQPGNAWRAWVTAPEVTQKEQLHIILKVTDKGSPALTRYQRIILTVEP